MSVIGLDVGTSRVKAVRFDASWLAVDSEAETTSVIRTDDGRSEQDMREVWACAVRVVAAVVQRSPDVIDLVAVTAQGDGCWLVDSGGEPVGNALLWNDNRAASIVEGWRADGTLDRAFRINGCLGAPGLASAQLRWLLQHEPDRLRTAATLLSCGSWVFANLTGRHVLEESDAANPFLHAATRRYDESLPQTFGIAALVRLLPPVVAGADRVAPLAAKAAASLGLPSGTPVALAPYDVPATAIGTGAVAVGSAFAVLGTTLCIGVAADDPRLSRQPNGMTLPGAEPGRWLLAYATMMGTEVLDWAARLLGVGDAAAVIALAATSRRADLPLMLPYLSPAGERSPFLDPAVRGALLGMDVNHTRADVARSVLDGLTLAVVDCVRAAGRPESLALSGGGAQSALWCQAICDAVAVPVIGPDVAEAGARGAVLAGATDAGMFANIGDAVARAVRPGRVHVPDAIRTARYAESYDRYVEARGR
jgi:erythritol kinase